MHAGGPRRNGGVGFAVQSPTAKLSCSASSEISCQDLRPDGLGAAELEQMLSVLAAARLAHKLPRGVRISISGEMPTHRGFGSGTALRLACIEGLFAVNNRALAATEAIALSKRGGTSGIGITTYFSGGLVLDLGVEWEDGAGFAPSAVAPPKGPPLVLGRLEMPMWTIGICIPREFTPKTQAEELDFFRRVAPLSLESSYETAYQATFGVYAAVAERNFDAFCAAVDALQETEWKQAERAEYGRKLGQLDMDLRREGARAVGMSSLGPALFFLGDEDAMGRIHMNAERFGSYIFLTEPANTGRVLLR